MITIIDYGMGNLRSVAKAVEIFTDRVQISSDPESIKESYALILPGDGAFGAAMENLQKGGWVGPLKKFIDDGGHFLGICLGYQLLFDSSEEFGTHAGLGVIPGKVVKFDDTHHKVPHMGWNQVSLKHHNKFMKGIDDNTYFYFIHTYYPVPADDKWIVGQANYDGDFTCIVGRNNAIATQFHPEKSHRAGLQIIKNFVEEACS